ncbi:MAG: hypothetical protein RPR28_06870 [Cycloclasticus sp.]
MEFWNQKTRYGLFHQADTNKPTYRPDMLLVFVHGIFGAPEETWAETPLWLSERLGSRLDILNFSYAAGLWQKSSIASASSDLKTCLESAYADYNFLIFITHSSGGLVVKHMLNQSFDDVSSQLDNGNFSFADSSALWLKTRRVINIAVPHQGSDPGLSRLAQSSYQYVYWLAKPLLSLLRGITQGAADVGKNEIIGCLRYQHPYLLALQEDNQRAVVSSQKNKLLYPSFFDIIGNADTAVANTELSGKRATLRGNHDSIKVPDHRDGPIMDVLVSQVEDFCGANYFLLLHAFESCKKLDSLNQQLGTPQLIGDDEQQPNSGSQSDTFNHLYQRFGPQKNRSPRQLLLTGSGGVGKSTVMRALLWQLSIDYLINPGQKQTVPLTIPLQMLSADDISGGLSWDKLWLWHENWISELLPNSAFKSSKITACFEQQAICVVFDGLDEFLALHHEINSSQLLNIFDTAMQRYRHNQNFSILTVCRNSLAEVNDFASHSGDIYRLSPLTLEQAIDSFPVCSKWLNHLQDKGLLEVVLTPLILSTLDEEMDCSAKQPVNTSHILRQSIDSILRKSSLTTLTLADGRKVKQSHLLLILTLIAWTFFKNALGEISLSRMRNEVQRIAKQWTAHLHTQQLEEEYANLKTSLSLLDDPQLIAGLVQRSLFVTTGHNKIRFSNRQWHDYLVALYFKQCLLLGYLDEFAETAFNPTIYTIAGELMHRDTISEPMVQHAITRWQATGKASIVSDMLAFISWTTVAIEPAAVRLLLSQTAHYNEITRIILLSSLGYRGLESSADDRSAKDIRAALLPTLRIIANCETCPIGDRIASSLAWCYLRAYAVKFGLPMIDKPWPDLRFNDDGQKTALSAMFTEVDGKFALNKYTKSLQIAFLSAVKHAQKNPDLLIRSMHYLYFLVIAKKFGAHVIELNDGLDELLSEQSYLARMLAEHASIPELAQLFQHFQTLDQQS